MSSFESEPPLVPAPILPAPAPAPATNVLFGPLGLRAGWGILLFFILTVAFTFAASYGIIAAAGKLPDMKQRQAQAAQERAHAKATHTQPPVHPMKVSTSFLTESGSAVAVLLAALALSLIERRRFAVYGLRLRHLRDLLPGAFWGLAAMALLVGVLRALHLVVFDSRLVHGAAVFRFGIAWLLLFLLVGVFEEFFFRGYIQFTLMRGLLRLAGRISASHTRLVAFWMSAVVWSLLFFVAHTGNAGENPAGLAGVFLAGILFSYALWRTGSLWWGIGFHMAWDWAQSFLFGVPDSGTLSVGRLFSTHAVGNPLLSGGVDGPEGSLLLLPVLALVFVVVRLHRQAEQPPVEPESLPSFLIPAAPQPVA